MRNNTLLLCAALMLPFAVSSAQRGGRGGGGGGGGGGGAPVARPATRGQIEDLNPANLLVDKRKKIGLADSTVNKLKALEKTIAERNKPLLQQYDSVRREIRFPNAAPSGGAMGAKMGSGSRSSSGEATFGGGGGSTMSSEDMAKMRTQLMALSGIAAQIRERRSVDLNEALALLAPDQMEKAKGFVSEQNDEFDRVLPSRSRADLPPE
jgi:hypothetical protein